MTTPYAGSDTVTLPTDPAHVRALQRAFAAGHQPWRADPIAVASVALYEVMKTAESAFAASTSADRLYLNLHLAEETERRAVVSGSGMRYDYRVYLERLSPTPRAGPGIWMAVEIEYAARRE
ncbi:MAG: hypothetical protein HY294_01455 [Candidatus Rokubacteria bacterium]|nr:hypothetical protein [Candidatus Rokubacteria bacterium]MBI3824647.1 hypothetical protein [Candidatus Rokubacteria bacterium]